MKLNIFCSTKKDGIMSNESKYFPAIKKAERNMLYQNTIKRFLKKTNIKYKNIIILNEKNNVYKTKIATENTSNIKENMIILKDKNPNIIVAVETSDSPVIVASAQNEEHNNVSIVSIATIENLNNNILTKMVDELMKITNAPSFEMTFYIGPCPAKENYKIKNIDLLQNKLWKNTYEKKNGAYFIDIRFAIFNQLIKEIVDPNNIYFDATDTVLSQKYFSEINSSEGKQLECVVYTND